MPCHIRVPLNHLRQGTSPAGGAPRGGSLSGSRSPCLLNSQKKISLSVCNMKRVAICFSSGTLLSSWSLMSFLKVFLLLPFFICFQATTLSWNFYEVVLSLGQIDLYLGHTNSGSQRKKIQSAFDMLRNPPSNFASLEPLRVQPLRVPLDRKYPNFGTPKTLV